MHQEENADFTLRGVCTHGCTYTYTRICVCAMHTHTHTLHLCSASPSGTSHRERACARAAQQAGFNPASNVFLDSPISWREGTKTGAL